MITAMAGTGPEPWEDASPHGRAAVRAAGAGLRVRFQLERRGPLPCRAAAPRGGREWAGAREGGLTRVPESAGGCAGCPLGPTIATGARPDSREPGPPGLEISRRGRPERGLSADAKERSSCPRPSPRPAPYRAAPAAGSPFYPLPEGQTCGRHPAWPTPRGRASGHLGPTARSRARPAGRGPAPPPRRAQRTRHTRARTGLLCSAYLRSPLRGHRSELWRPGPVAGGRR